MHKNEDQKKSNNGLPDIAQQLTNKRSTLLMMLVVFVVTAMCLHFFSKPKIKTEKSDEEIYSIQTPIPTATTQDQLPATETQPSSVEQSQEVVQPKEQITTEQIAFIQQKQKELQQRLSAPMMIVNNSVVDKQTETSSQSSASQASDPNTQFMNQVSGQNTTISTATTIGPLNTIIAEGSLIHATMESASNSDLPGYLRASVSEPVYSEDATQVLVPVGSRLIGQYKSGMLQGQGRIFIVWTRLITPSGISVSLGSPGTDSLGVAGVGADEIDRHFWQRFGTASLLSILGAGAANMNVAGNDQQNSASVYREAVASSFSQSASQSLQQQSMIAPTLKTYQGKPIIVFVAKDLHFANVMQQVTPKLNVF